MTSRVAEAVSGASVKSTLLTLGGISGGVSLTYLLVEILKTDPELSRMAMQTVMQWGPMFVLFAAVLYLNDRRFGQMIHNQNESQKQTLEVQRENTTAQQKMADAVHRLAEKDYERQREMELVIAHMGRDAKRTRELLEDMDRQLRTIRGEEAHGHHAG